MEWGEGDESPDTFSPTELDCRQWARVCRGRRHARDHPHREAPRRLLPLADGAQRALGPIERLEERGGRRAPGALRGCREYGLFLGIYLSPWDQNHPTYGDSPAYNEVFKGQLREVLTRYGEVSEVWFDGACGEGPNGKRQVYDWPGFVAVVREHQPGAVIFSDAGPDVRWVGNERGYADETNWCTLRRDEFYPGTPRYEELTRGHEDGSHWVPTECNTSIRPAGTTTPTRTTR